MVATKKLPRKVYFTVDFAGMTARVREFWAEGRYEYAMMVCTDGFNLTKEQASDVLNGRKKMVQDPRGTKGCDGMLVDDDWTPKKSSFGFYPEASSAPLAAVVVAQQKEIARLNDQLDEQDRLEYDGPAARLGRVNHTLGLMGVAGIPSPTAMIDNMLSLDSRPTPKPDTTYASGNGWVLPNGNFYPCENSMEHIWLADRLGKDERAAELAGWVKLCTPIFDVYVISQKPPTQRQITTVFAWAERRDVTNRDRQKPAKAWLDEWNNKEL